MTTSVRSSPRISTAFETGALRADELASQSTSARAPLEFASGLLRAQGAAARELEDLQRAQPFTGQIDHDADRILWATVAVLRFAADKGPGLLAGEARRRIDEPAVDARIRLASFWAGGVRAREDYLSRALLRPFVATLRQSGVTPVRMHARGHCPCCAGAPVTSCRRGGSQSEGGVRSLACALCGLEWSVNRIVCPACFETEPRKLPVFAVEEQPLARIEACETCGRYLKSIDFSRDPRAVAEVDDVATLALDLWALEQGFTRIEPGLAGV